MGTKAKFHGPAFAGLETTERLSNEQIDEWTEELFGQLTQDEKIVAGNIYATLLFLQRNLKEGNLTHLKQRGLELLTSAGFKVDYLEIADANDLTLLNNWDGRQSIVAVAAVFIRDVRLIDNMLLG